MKKSILIVDDDTEFREYLSNVFKEDGYRVTQACNATEGLDVVIHNKINLLITDIKMPGKDGLEFLNELRSVKPKLPVIVVTGFSTSEIVSTAIKNGAINFFEKPFPVFDLLAYADVIINLFSDINIHYRAIAPYIHTYEKKIVLESKEKIIDVFPNYMARELIELGYCTETESLPITTAVIEALSNSLYHGNLKIKSDIRNSGSLKGQRFFKNQVHERENDEAYFDKKITLCCVATVDEIKFTIEDSGIGFSWQKYLTTNCDLTKFSGKGLFLIHSLVDKVEYNEKGNIITLTKKVIKHK